ncbi:MAG: amino-acid N-acetyltransferase, partial [Paraglaciecola polaris]
MVLSHNDSVKLFRNSAPYINAHRGKTFVLMFGGEAVEDANFANIIQDIALLNSLGVRLILVHGARPQIDQRVALRHVEPRFSDDLRITDKQTLECVKDAAGSVRSQIEALLTMGLANSPMHGAQIRVCSGNLVVAMPIGVRNGVDYEHTGLVRRIDVTGINDHLDDGSIVLLPPMGYSPTGEVFNLSHEDVATNA